MIIIILLCVTQLHYCQVSVTLNCGGGGLHPGIYAQPCFTARDLKFAQFAMKFEAVGCDGNSTHDRDTTIRDQFNNERLTIKYTHYSQFFIVSNVA